MKIIPILAALSLSALLSACGDGGGSASQTRQPTTPNPPPVAPDGNQWQFGVFPDESEFKDKCEIVRTMPDINGEAYPDTRGTSFDEKMWLRSWSNNTYLWYDEITDRDPEDFETPLAYFDVLVTNERTMSGARKDNFHFAQPTEEFESFAETGSSSGYGINWAFIESAPPRNFTVSSIEASSPNANSGVQRGDKIVEINSIDFVESDIQSEIDSINEALFPSEDGIETLFTFERTDGSQYSVTLTSGTFISSFVNNAKVIDTDVGRTGYVRFDGFQRTAQAPLINTFQYFVDENVTDLVLDLRYNGGGLVAMSAQLGYMIAGPNQTNNRVFELFQFNDQHPTIDPLTGDTIRPIPFFDREIDWENGVFTNNTLPNLGLSKVYVITTEDTCSASESLINGLRGIDIEVVQIGGTTCGKPFGFEPTDNCGTTYFTIQFQGVNDKGFGEFSDGFKVSDNPRFDDELPGCRANDDFKQLLGNENEAMLATALHHINNRTCPVFSSQTTTAFASKKVSEKRPDVSIYDARYRSFLLENSIYIDVKEPSEQER
ncbi:S41 family peptidase [Agaribacter flavus]|uniref:S41 family peptidase n=1 Tax=Agaribacter flavus TaxID=1902781 RepID=A0ABV7FKH7_9ALTE